MKSSEVDLTRQKKQLGQNWLIDEKAVNLFINFCGISRADTVLEIGVGKLALTRPLIEKANKVVAIEIDPNLVQQAKSTAEAGCWMLNVRQADFLQTNLTDLIKMFGTSNLIKAILLFLQYFLSPAKSTF
jgi:16S rRNA A1518/A1519 N6-dimethyltransferase RsmA/KsgA/DIM1 with predicted DNA glycosylase/AP lyase activity